MTIDQLAEIVVAFEKKQQYKHIQFIHANTPDTAIIHFEPDFYLLVEDILVDLNMNIKPLTIFDYVIFCESNYDNITYLKWLTINGII
jgi:hypothetical protein